jgi:hypothetical protein
MPEIIIQFNSIQFIYMLTYQRKANYKVSIVAVVSYLASRWGVLFVVVRTSRCGRHV